MIEAMEGAKVWPGLPDTCRCLPRFPIWLSTIVGCWAVRPNWLGSEWGSMYSMPMPPTLGSVGRCRARHVRVGSFPSRGP